LPISSSLRRKTFHKTLKFSQEEEKIIKQIMLQRKRKKMVKRLPQPMVTVFFSSKINNCIREFPALELNTV
jgi:hypothetical protein